MITFKEFIAETKVSPLTEVAVKMGLAKLLKLPLERAGDLATWLIYHSDDDKESYDPECPEWELLEVFYSKHIQGMLPIEYNPVFRKHLIKDLKKYGIDLSNV